MIVYLAGPMTPKDGYTLEQNVEAASTVYFRLVRERVPTFCPHLGASLQNSFDTSYETWLRYAYVVIDQCTHVLMLPRWETSYGATLERSYALRKGKQVVYDVEELF